MISIMRITVFGASGKVGRLVVDKLLRDGHYVRAFVHSNSHLRNHKRLQVISGDIHDKAAVSKAIEGADAVISALGSWGTPSKDIVSTGTKNIIPAMKKHKIRRIVSLTGSGAKDDGEKLSLLDMLSRYAVRVFARKVFDDGEQHIALLRASKLDWTVVRSPLMRESSRRREYVLSRRSPLPWATIVRDDVASAMVELVGGKEWRQTAPFIKRP